MHLTIEDTYTNSRNEQLECRLSLPTHASKEKPVPIVITTHGFAGSIACCSHIARITPALVDGGAAVFSYNMTGVGKDKNGREKIDTRYLNTSQAARDTRSATDKMFQMLDGRGDENNVMGWFMSLGAQAAMVYQVQPDAVKFKSMLLCAPVTNTLHKFKDDLTFGYGINRILWKFFGKVVRKVNGQEAAIGYEVYEDAQRYNFIEDIAPKITSEVTIIGCKEDDMVSINDVNKLHDNMKKSPQKTLYEINAPHIVSNEFSRKRVMYYTLQACKKTFGENFVLPGHHHGGPNGLQHIASA